MKNNDNSYETDLKTNREDHQCSCENCKSCEEYELITDEFDSEKYPLRVYVDFDDEVIDDIDDEYEETDYLDMSVTITVEQLCEIVGEAVDTALGIVLESIEDDIEEDEEAYFNLNINLNSIPEDTEEFQELIISILNNVPSQNKSLNISFN